MGTSPCGHQVRQGGAADLHVVLPEDERRVLEPQCHDVVQGCAVGFACAQKLDERRASLLVDHVSQDQKQSLDQRRHVRRPEPFHYGTEYLPDERV